MNKELINKYWNEFCHWKDGGSVLVNFRVFNSSWEENNGDIFSYTGSISDIDIIINDEYSTFRKALAEGKTIEEYYDVCGQTGWTYMHGEFTKYKKYRVKPDESKFKVGDWIQAKVLLKDNSTTYAIAKVTSPTSCKIIQRPNNWAILYENMKDAKLWQPQPDEWCWFWSESNHPILGQFNYMNTTRPDLGEPKYQVKHLLGCCFDKCEPFIGQLPTNLRNNHG